MNTAARPDTSRRPRGVGLAVAASAGSAGRAERESTEGEAAQREERYGPVQPEGSGAPAPGAGGLTLDEPRRDSERAGAATDDGGPGMPIAVVLAVLALTGAWCGASGAGCFAAAGRRPRRLRTP